jgi:hypothetical protein
MRLHPHLREQICSRGIPQAAFSLAYLSLIHTHTSPFQSLPRSIILQQPIAGRWNDLMKRKEYDKPIWISWLEHVTERELSCSSAAASTWWLVAFTTVSCW